MHLRGERGLANYEGEGASPGAEETGLLMILHARAHANEKKRFPGWAKLDNPNLRTLFLLGGKISVVPEQYATLRVTSILQSRTKLITLRKPSKDEEPSLGADLLECSAWIWCMSSCSSSAMCASLRPLRAPTSSQRAHNHRAMERPPLRRTTPDSPNTMS